MKKKKEKTDEYSLYRKTGMCGSFTHSQTHFLCFSVTSSGLLFPICSGVLRRSHRPEGIYPQLLHKSSRRSKWAVSLTGSSALLCHKAGSWEEVLHGEGCVSEAGWWAERAAGCLCDLTGCVNQVLVFARPASLISICLQIIARRQCKGAEL